MKIKKLYILAALLTVGALPGCQIEEKLYGTIDDTNYWRTEQHIREAINGAYSRLTQDFHGFSIWHWIIEDGGADYNAGTSPYGDFLTYNNWSSTVPDGIDWGIYKYFWSQVAYLNKALDKMPETSMSDEKKAYYKAEARALRAFIYFTMAQWFGDLPMVTSSTDNRLAIAKTPVAEIYAFIETELSESVNGLPAKDEMIAGGATEYTRLTKGAALGILARVYLVQKKYDLCRDACRKLVEEQDVYGSYKLMESYKSVFATKGYANPECLWTLATNASNNSSRLQVYLYKLWDVEGKTIVRDKSYDVYANWSGSLSVTKAFYDSFDDERKTTCLMYSEFCNANAAMITKFPADTPDGMSSASDIPIIRYSDVLLMYAESFLLGSTQDLPNAVKYVNQVRERAKATQYNAANYTVESFKEKIYQERRWELYYEGCGKRDMLRFDKLLDHIAATSKDAGVSSIDYYKKYYLLPFPLSALDANPALVQNPGYLK